MQIFTVGEYGEVAFSLYRGGHMVTDTPPPVVVPENRYDLLEDAQDVWDPSVAVVVPTYNQVDRLHRTLTGLSRQTRLADEIIVADDGSDEDVQSVVAEFTDLPVRLEHQEHVGFGAGRARNMGARAAESDVLIFLDADCIPSSGFVEAHHRWHRRSTHLVAVGVRHDIDEGLIGAVDDAGLVSIAQGVPDDGAPSDWRRMFYSTNRRLRTGDDAFRAFVSANVSVTRDSFLDAGGFVETFTDWGGEDTELGWRLWNAGATFAVANDAVAFHQVRHDETREGRERSRARQRIVVADRVPHRFYRPGPASFYTVPHVSFILAPESEDELLSSWEAISRSTYPDTELIVVGDGTAVEPASRLASSDRFTVLPGSVAEAIRRARGEFVVIVDGRVRINPSFVATAVGRMQAGGRVGVIRGGYIQADDTRVAKAAEIAHVDAELGRQDMPLLVAVRRRELMKELALDGRIDWRRLTERVRQGLAFEGSDLEGVPVVVDAPSRIGVADIRQAGARQTSFAIGTVVGRLTGRDTGANS